MAGHLEGPRAEPADDELVLSLREGSMRALVLFFERYAAGTHRP